MSGPTLIPSRTKAPGMMSFPCLFPCSTKSAISNFLMFNLKHSADSFFFAGGSCLNDLVNLNGAHNFTTDDVDVYVNRTVFADLSNLFLQAGLPFMINTPQVMKVAVKDFSSKVLNLQNSLFKEIDFICYDDPFEPAQIMDSFDLSLSKVGICFNARTQKLEFRNFFSFKKSQIWLDNINSDKEKTFMRFEKYRNRYSTMIRSVHFKTKELFHEFLVWQAQRWTTSNPMAQSLPPGWAMPVAPETKSIFATDPKDRWSDLSVVEEKPEDFCKNCSGVKLVWRNMALVCPSCNCFFGGI